MPEVSFTVATAYFYPHHAVTTIGFVTYAILGLWLPETWPAASGVEFFHRAEKRTAAAYAVIDTFFLAGIKRTGEGCLGTFLATDSILFWCEYRLPVALRLSRFLVLYGHVPVASVAVSVSTLWLSAILFSKASRAICRSSKNHGNSSKSSACGPSTSACSGRG